MLLLLLPMSAKQRLVEESPPPLIFALERRGNQNLIDLIQERPPFFSLVWDGDAGERATAIYVGARQLVARGPILLSCNRPFEAVRMAAPGKIQPEPSTSDVKNPCPLHERSINYKADATSRCLFADNALSGRP